MAADDINSTHLAELREGAIPPIDAGLRIGPRALIINDGDLAAAAAVSDRVLVNAKIAFRLDSPGGLSDVNNDDNWGAGAQGYWVEKLRLAGATGKGVRIGIADSGVDAQHPTFAALRSDDRLIAYAGFDAEGRKEVQHDATGALVADDKAVPGFTHWHGTFCAAVLVGQDVDGKLRGIAPAAELAVAKVLQQFSNGTVASIYAGLAWLADQKCDIVSLSLGWEGKHDDWATPIQALLDQGVVVVVAAGNSFGVPGVPPSDSPANYPLTDPGAPQGLLISVGSIDPDGALADSSGGETADWSAETGVSPVGAAIPSVFAAAAPCPVPQIVAPGVGVISAAPGNTYRQESGTSMATPHVAGLIAAVLQALRARSLAARPRDAAELVLGCLTPLASPDARGGQGRVDIAKLVHSLAAL